MANRALLHRNTLEEFERWMFTKGWRRMAPAQGSYERLRMQKDGEWFLLYDRHRGDHLVARDQDVWIIREFFKERGLPVSVVPSP